MDLTIFSQLSLGLLASAVAITLFAGVVKGAVGFALPLIMVSGLSSIIDPKLALAGMILPALCANTLQSLRTGLRAALSTIREYWRYLLVLGIAIFLTAQLVVLMPDRVFFAVLGIPVVALCLIQLAGFRLHVRPEHRFRAEWIIGAISGAMGGLAGTWGPTTVLYLMAIDAPKARQMIVQGVIYGVGSVVLLVAHLESGILNAQTIPLSLMFIVPAFTGMWIGFGLQDRMNQIVFRKVTLIVLAFAGLNLIRRAILG